MTSAPENIQFYCMTLPLTETAMVLVDTTGCGCEELDTQEDQSKGNKGEAVLVASRVTALVEAGVPESAVAVITPYNLQVWFIAIVLLFCLRCHTETTLTDCTP